MRLLAELQMGFRISAEGIEGLIGTVYVGFPAIFSSGGGCDHAEEAGGDVRAPFEITPPEAEL